MPPHFQHPATVLYDVLVDYVQEVVTINPQYWNTPAILFRVWIKKHPNNTHKACPISIIIAPQLPPE